VRHVWEFSVEQVGELTRLARSSDRPYVRVRAIALCHLAAGRSCEEAARAVFVNRVSVGQWARRYLDRGAEGLFVDAGRGNFSKADRSEVESYLRRPPREFGVPRTRWTLEALVQVVPCLKGMTPSGAHRVLERFGFSYKRGQPRLHSPDPDYEAKRGPS
jgi:transposase